MQHHCFKKDKWKKKTTHFVVIGNHSPRGALDSQNYIYYIILVQTKKTLFNILPHKTEKGEQSKQGEQ